MVYAVEPEWLARHLDEGLFPQVAGVAGNRRFSSASPVRARRMRQLERGFDAVPELRALLADALEELDALRVRLHRAGAGPPSGAATPGPTACKPPC